MDAAYLHARAATCRRLAQTLPRDNPGRYYLLEIADDLLASELKLRRGQRRLRDHAYANSYQQTGSAIPERLADPSRASLPGSTFPSQHGSDGHIERVALNY
jgi:hypothetical protein